VLCAGPRCSISPEPRWEEYTICTAVAPDDVFTVRMYGGRAAHTGNVFGLSQWYGREMDAPDYTTA
jgi:hypothetical protein